MDTFKTIAIFNYAHEIIVIKHLLEQESIVHLFENENLVSVDPFGSFAYGGIKLKIHQNDFEKVQALLDHLNNNLKIV
ncbi:DUF2007 domain-containing protein [Flavobacterium sp. K77]|uniref:DUF2007 domain-containing protein n=1 Tax=Flavobacterium sp. K77 TaxID=2910676 RepID=UPI001F3A9DF9|nr:DUF2007 domain-containing protein [Flavobacterium sp. K77]MCF6139743.1 DUF2007 domain-containing protein [Flavobacterium sp. K77]